ncbi:hypothetical protein RJT34_13333 [Clitoria ternatea]|uniref:RING-type E3 ubiquitin transferase n=1 Tax=Clitoria ternatea TaxID=43366 RepID=A0AAN9JQY4_CLITE
MSLNARPRIVVNGVRRTRTFHYFWCLHCQRTVRIPSTNTHNNIASLCPYCFHQLRFELDITRPRLLMNVPNNLDPSPASQIIHSLAFILDPSLRRQNNPLNSTPTSQWETENDEDSANPQAWITLRFVRPGENLVPQTNDTPLDDLIDRVDTQNNNRPGPPPATSSAIAALPMVKVTHEHLATDLNCPICKDEFQLDMEVRELPCKHFYHSDCVIPWLLMHNTCPVCRYELEGVPRSNYTFQNVNEQRLFGIEDVASSLNWVWTQVVSFRPIRALLDWTQSYFDFHQNHIPGRRGKIKL